MRRPLDVGDFILEEFSYSAFPRGARVLDVGCGSGQQLEALREAGFDAAGVEPCRDAVAELVAKGLDVRPGVAERLPFPDESFDGLICKVVLPYTDERQAVKEWARVLRPGGRVLACFHGAGYYARYLLSGPGAGYRFYGLRSLVNTWWLGITGHRLPGFIGDTIYQSNRRLVRYYREFGFRIERAPASPTYLGKPVFMYQQLCLAPRR